MSHNWKWLAFIQIYFFVYIKTNKCIQVWNDDNILIYEWTFKIKPNKQFKLAEDICKCEQWYWYLASLTKQ